VAFPEKNMSITDTFPIDADYTVTRTKESNVLRAKLDARENTSDRKRRHGASSRWSSTAAPRGLARHRKLPSRDDG